MRSLFRRKSDKRLEEALDLVETEMALAAQLMQEAKRRNYADGLADGTAITLSLLLGRDRLPDGSSTFGKPYDGVLPAEVRSWAEKALQRACDQRIRANVTRTVCIPT